MGAVNVQLNFTANTSAAKKNIDDLQHTLSQISAGSAGSKDLFGSATTHQIQEASAAALQLKQSLAKCTDVTTGKLNLASFNADLAKAGTNVQQLQQSLLAAGSAGMSAFTQLNNAIIQSTNKANSLFNKNSQIMRALSGALANQIASKALQATIGSISSAYSYAQRLDTSLNNIRIVTGQSADQMKDFAIQANKAAQSLSTTTTQYTDAALIFYQQGLNGKDVTGRTDTVVKLSNVTGQSAQQVSEQLTAIWNNFDDYGDNFERYADIITALGATTASSSAEIAEGLGKFAAIAKTTGLSYDYATSALATLVAATRQSADTVGTSLKTLFSRLQGLQLGDTLEDGVDLNKYSGALAKVGVQALDASGQMRDLDTILEDLAGRWGDLTDAQKMALAQTVAGVRQYNVLISLMDNWDKMQQNLDTASGASGTLQKQQEIYEESWTASQKRLKAAMESIYDTLIDEDFFIGLTNIGTYITKGVDSAIQSLGGLKGVIFGLLSILNTTFAPKVAAIVDGTIEKTKLMFTSKAGQKAQKEQFVQDNVQMYKQYAALNYGQDSFRAENMSQTYGEIARLQTSYVQISSELSASQKGIVEGLMQQQQLLSQNVEKRIEETEASEQATEGWKAYTKGAFEHELGIGSSEVNPYIDKNGNYTEAALQLDPQELTAFESKYGSSTLDDMINEYEKLNRVAGEADQAARTLQQSISKIGQGDTAANIENIKQQFEQFTKDFSRDDIFTAFGDSAAQAFDKVQQAMQNGDPSEISKAWEQFYSQIVLVGKNSDISTPLRTMKDDIVQFAEICGQSEQGLAEFNEGLTKMGANAQVNGRNIRQTAEAQQILSASTDEAIAHLEQLQIKNQSIGSSFAVLAGKMSTLAMSLSTIGGSFDTLADTGTSASQKIIAGLTLAATAGRLYAVVTDEGTAKILANIGAKAAQAAIDRGLTTATLTAAAAQASLNAAMIVGLGIFGAAIALIALLTYVIIANAKAEENRNKAIKKSNEAYQEEANKLQTLKDKLDGINEKIDELKSKGPLSLIEQSELAKLEQERAATEALVAAQEKITQAKLEAANAAMLNQVVKSTTVHEKNILDLSKEDNLEEYNARLEALENYFESYGNIVKQYGKDSIQAKQTLDFIVEYQKNRIYGEDDYLAKVVSPIVNNGLKFFDEKTGFAKRTSELENYLSDNMINYKDFVAAYEAQINTNKDALKRYSKLSDEEIDSLSSRELYLAYTIDVSDIDNVESYRARLAEATSTAIIEGSIDAQEQLNELAAAFKKLLKLSPGDLVDSKIDVKKLFGDEWQNWFTETIDGGYQLRLDIDQADFATKLSEVIAVAGEAANTSVSAQTGETLTTLASGFDTIITGTNQVSQNILSATGTAVETTGQYMIDQVGTFQTSAGNAASNVVLTLDKGLISLASSEVKTLEANGTILSQEDQLKLASDEVVRNASTLEEIAGRLLGVDNASLAESGGETNIEISNPEVIDTIDDYWSASTFRGISMANQGKFFTHNANGTLTDESIAEQAWEAYQILEQDSSQSSRAGFIGFDKEGGVSAVREENSNYVNYAWEQLDKLVNNSEFDKFVSALTNGQSGSFIEFLNNMFSADNQARQMHGLQEGENFNFTLEDLQNGKYEDFGLTIGKLLLMAQDFQEQGTIKIEQTYGTADVYNGAASTLTGADGKPTTLEDAIANNQDAQDATTATINGLNSQIDALQSQINALLEDGASEDNEDLIAAQDSLASYQGKLKDAITILQQQVDEGSQLAAIQAILNANSDRTWQAPVLNIPENWIKPQIVTNEDREYSAGGNEFVESLNLGEDLSGETQKIFLNELLTSMSESLGKDFDMHDNSIIQDYYKLLQSEAGEALVRDLFGEDASQEDIDSTIASILGMFERYQTDNTLRIENNNKALLGQTSIEGFNSVYAQQQSEQGKDFNANEQEYDSANLARLEQVAQQSASEKGLNYEDVSKTADGLQKLYENTVETRQEALRLAENVQKAQKGFESFGKNGSKWLETINKGLKPENLAEYSAAMDGLKQAFSDVTGIQKDFISDDFIKENAELLENALGGDLEALQEITIKAVLDLESVQSLSDDLQQFISQAAEITQDLEVGTSLDTAGLTDGFQAMLDAGQVTADEMNAILEGIGYDPDISMQEISFDASSAVNADTEGTYLDAHGQQQTIKLGSASVVQNNGKYYVPIINGNSSSKKVSGGGGASTQNKSGGGGGGNKKPKEKKEADTKDRYHTVNEQLDDISKSLNKLNKAEDRAFGVNKIKTMTKELGKLNQQVNKYGDKLKEAQQYMDQDAAKAQEYASKIGMSIQTGSNGEILNWDQLKQGYLDWYNEQIDKYNSDEIDDEAFSEIEKEYSKAMQAFEQYEETNNLIQELKQNILEAKQAYEDMLLAIQKEKLEIQIKVDENGMKLLEYFFDKLDDDLYDCVYRMSYIEEEMANLIDQASKYESNINNILSTAGEWVMGEDGKEEFQSYGLTLDDLPSLLEKTPEELQEIFGGDEANVKEIIDQLQGDYDNLLKVNKDLADKRKEMFQQIGITFDAWNEQIDKSIDKIAANSKVMEHYRNVIDIVGRKTLGITSSFIKDYNLRQVKNDIAQLSGEFSQLNEMRAAASQLEAKIMAETNEESRKLMQKELDKMNKAIQDQTEQTAQAWEDAMRGIQQAYADTVQVALDDWQTKMAGLAGSADMLKLSFDMATDLDDNYLDDYDKIYELTKLTNNINKSIDETDNLKSKEDLIELMEKVNKLNESDAEISQYTVDILNARYDLLLAEQALKEAQNAKSMVRMTQDNEGNWGYVYTADEDKIQQAEQEYADKLHALEEINQNYLDELDEKLANLAADASEKIMAIVNDSTLSLEEKRDKIKEVYEYTNQMEQFLMGQTQLALGDAMEIYDQDARKYSEMTGNKMLDDEKWVNSFEEMKISQITGFEELEDWGTAFTDSWEETCNELESTTDGFVELNHKAFETVEMDMDNAAEEMGEDLDAIEQDTKEVRDSIIEMSETAEEEIGLVIDFAATWSQAWSDEIDKIITKNEWLAKSCDEIIQKLADVQALDNLPDEDETGDGEDTPLPSAPSSAPSNPSPQACNDCSGSCSGSCNTGCNTECKNGCQGKCTDQCTGGCSTSQAAYDQAYRYGGYDTGGYTGIFADTGMYTGEWPNGSTRANGKLAFLHQKELVLNAHDTENFLDAIEIVRSLNETLDLGALSMSKGIGNLSIAGLKSEMPQSLDQNVTITAEFPNVQNRSEIEAAFENLVNRAAQYANRKS